MKTLKQELEKLIGKSEIVKSKDLKKYHYTAKVKIVEAKSIFEDVLKEINQKRCLRKSYKSFEQDLSLYEKLQAMKLKRFTEVVTTIHPFLNVYSDLKVSVSGNLEFTTEKLQEWGYYSRSYNFPKVTTIAYLKIPKIVSLKDLVYDGIVTLKIHSRSIKNGITLLDATILSSVKRDFCEKRVKIVVKGNYSYHAETYSEAIGGLFDKIQKTVKSYFHKNFITLESEITRNLYSELTGACRFGVNEFCIKNNLQDKKSIKLKDLLPLLEESNAYGYESILKVLKNTEKLVKVA
jgi:hypothetical protein